MLEYIENNYDVGFVSAGRVIWPKNRRLFLPDDSEDISEKYSKSAFYGTSFFRRLSAAPANGELFLRGRPGRKEAEENGNRLKKSE